MRRIMVLLFLLLSLSAANAARYIVDARLGSHDVLGVGANAGARMGCQACHIPHNTRQEYYLWRHQIPTTVGVETLPTLNSASFHTNSCMSCHDGATASDVKIRGYIPPALMVASDSHGLKNDHPVNVMLKQEGTTAPSLGFTVVFSSGSLLNAGDPTNNYLGKEYGYVECASCHDPHIGTSYAFLRAPAGRDADPDFAKLELCRDCHVEK